jgi:hypothetical protein
LLWVAALPAAWAEDGGIRHQAHGGSATEPAEHDGEEHASAEHTSRLTEETIPLQLEAVPERPNFLVELGNPYLGTGRIAPGVKLPTGTIWQPTLIVFGNLRSAVQTFDDGETRRSEWANRLDLFANLQLSGTERLVIGFRNLDRDGRFTSYVLEPDPNDPAFPFEDQERFHEELNAEIQTLFFEGEFGEIFPRLDKSDFGRKDIGFSIGRQSLLFQEGMLINDSVDGIGLTRNTLLPKNTSNFRATLFLGADNIDRANVEDESAGLFGLLTSVDFRRSTVDADLVYVTGDDPTGNLVAFGVSSVQRLGKFNTSFRVLGSWAVDDETPFATDGAVLFSEVSWTPHHSFDLIYFTTFWAIDSFVSAARAAATGGPLGRAGVNFAAVGLGNYGAPLSSQATEVAGGAVGYQKFFGVLKRRQLLAELGARIGTSDEVANAAAATLRYQMAFGRRLVVVLDGFGGYRESVAPGDDDDAIFGGRVELLLKF